MSGELPEGWADTTIGKVAAYVSRGKSPRYAARSTLPVINQKCIRWTGLQSEHLKFVAPEQFEAWAPERFVREGDILWNSTGTGTIGRACLVSAHDIEIPKVVDSHVTIVRVDAAVVDPRYLLFWIQGREVQNVIEDLATGTTNQIELNRQIVTEMALPLPPLAEQRRLVTKVEGLLARVNAARERLEKVPLLLKRFRQSVLAKAFQGELVPAEAELAKLQGRAFQSTTELSGRLGDDVPEGWALSRLDKITTAIQYGYTASAEPNRPGPRFLRITDIQNGRVDWKSVPGCDISAEDLAKYRLLAGDIVFARSGATTGKSFLIAEAPPEAVFASYLIRVRANRELVEPAYLARYFQSPEYWTYITDNVAGNAQPNCNGSKLAALDVPLPPLEEQRRIAARVDSLFSMADSLERAENRTRAQLLMAPQAILEKGLAGELVPTEAELARDEGRAFESADELLRRSVANAIRSTPAESVEERH